MDAAAERNVKMNVKEADDNGEAAGAAHQQNETVTRKTCTK
jgi:hypothetical protein